MPWLLSEDQALKSKLQGLTVTDVNAPVAGRPVAVRFRLPETELSDLTFPTVVIDHAGISEATDRAHRGYVPIPYSPEGYATWEGVGDPAKSPLWSQFPIPYNLDYQVSVLSRKAMHNMSLLADLAKMTRLPARFGFLEIPQDGTIRRLDLLNGPELSDAKDNDGKRLFTSTYAIRVSSELLPEQIDTFTKVLTVSINLKEYSDVYDVPHVA